MSHPLIFQTPYQFPSYPDNHQILQYSTAYFNPYEVKHRKRTSRAQLQVLEATFQQSHKPSSAVKKALSTQLDMPLRNVQVWFQNRRAKDKHLANRAKAKAAASQGNAASSSETPDSGATDDAQDGPRSPSDNLNSASTPETSPTAEFAAHLTPPANIALRRGSAPAPLGQQPHRSPDADPLPQTSPNTNNRPPQSTRQFLVPPDPPHTGDHSGPLARRRSLPVFHPQHRSNSILPPGAPSLPTITDYSHSEDNHSSSLSPPHFSYQSEESTSSPPTGHRPPYPHPSGTVPTNYRSCSTPGTSVFRVPDPSQWSRQPKDEANRPPHPGASFAAPFAFPPARVASIPSSGPLPRADFSFGVHDESAETEAAVHESPRPNTGDEEEVDPRALGLGSHRFGSFASIASSNYSVDTDVTGVTATTGTSDQSFHLAAAAAAAATMTNMGLRSRGPMTLGPSYSFPGNDNSHYNGSSLSYGNELSVGPPPVRFPAGFDPDLRRASCPAQFMEMFSSLGVDHSASSHPQSSSSFQQPQQVFPKPPSGLKKSPSHAALSKSPLGLRVHVPNSSQYNSHTYGEEKIGQFREPLTAVVSDFSQPLLSTPLGSLDESAEGFNEVSAPSQGDSAYQNTSSAPTSASLSAQPTEYQGYSSPEVQGTSQYQVDTTSTAKSYAAEMYQPPFFPADGAQQAQNGYDVNGGMSSVPSYGYGDFSPSNSYGTSELQVGQSFHNNGLYQVEQGNSHQLQPSYPSYHRGSVDLTASSLAGALETSTHQSQPHALRW
ncbi:hypothetical protein FRC03_003942 [Tulasnella sp. 419]|nr:hypothetical protein FRC03_003942 [Tulasnella sp. 419]